MARKEPIKRFYDKTRNRFMSLRYKSDTDEYPTITGETLAKELGYSKGTISSLERPNGDVLTKQAGLFKAYHDYFGCSYEYLFGEAELPDPKYKELETSSPLANLDNNSLNNLEQLLSSKGFKDFNSYMLKAFLAEPNDLQGIMNIIFRFMYVLNQIYNNNELNNAEKELQATRYWYSLNSQLDTYLKDSLLPHLQVGFEKYERNEDKRSEEEIKQMYKDLEQYEAEMKAPIEVTYIEKEGSR